jgi:hypothetical protein
VASCTYLFNEIYEEDIAADHSLQMMLVIFAADRFYE